MQSVEGGSTPLTDDEEQRMRAMLFGELGNEIADRGWVRFPKAADMVDVTPAKHRHSSIWFA
ncbi:hypothetical protein [Streptomyces sp. NPDC058545]|uniref:hypothetical protein n=1 Tax=Streptomyces sp. NPDC058545 TaxID=3346544 RepID=UPI003652E506